MIVITCSLHAMEQTDLPFENGAVSVDEHGNDKELQETPLPGQVSVEPASEASSVSATPQTSTDISSLPPSVLMRRPSPAIEEIDHERVNHGRAPVFVVIPPEQTWAQAFKNVFCRCRKS